MIEKKLSAFPKVKKSFEKKQAPFKRYMLAKLKKHTKETMKNICSKEV